MMWTIELGRVDIFMDVSCLSQNLCYPREGCLNTVYFIFRYLQKNVGKNPRSMTYHTMYELTEENVFEFSGRYLNLWEGFYHSA